MKRYPEQEKLYHEFLEKYEVSAGLRPPEDLFVLLEEVEKLKPNSNYVEFGIAQGCSLVSVLNFRKDINCYGIDDTTKPIIEKIISDINPPNLTLFLNQKSEDLCKTWDKEIDLLFIDGGHYFPNVFWDFVGWWPHVKEGGTIIFHDFEEVGNDKFDVGKALNIIYGHPKYNCHVPARDDCISTSMFIIKKDKKL